MYGAIPPLIHTCS